MYSQSHQANAGNAAVKTASMFHSLIPCLDYLQLLEEGELILESNSIHTKTWTVDR